MKIEIKKEEALNILEVLWKAMMGSISAPASGLTSDEERAYEAFRGAAHRENLKTTDVNQGKSEPRINTD